MNGFEDELRKRILGVIPHIVLEKKGGFISSKDTIEKIASDSRISSVSTFFVTPINFLSGVFFTINTIPESFKFILYYNPYYYVVNNFRSSFYFNFEYNFNNNLLILFFVLMMLFLACYVFHKGFKVIK